MLRRVVSSAPKHLNLGILRGIGVEILRAACLL